MHKRPSRYPPEVLALVIERQGARRCCYCGCFDGLEVEHRTPLKRGGDNHHSNLALACATCNRSKGARPLREMTRDHKMMRKRKR